MVLHSGPVMTDWDAHRRERQISLARRLLVFGTSENAVDDLLGEEIRRAAQDCHEPSCDYDEPHRHGFACGPLCPEYHGADLA